MSRYHEVYEGWKKDPEGFWAEAAEAIDWYKPWDKVYAEVDGLDRWFVGAECNTCYNCIDRHIEDGRGDQAAVIYDSPVTDQVRTYTYNELRDEVAAFAAVLQDNGTEKGDRVICYMPMIPEALFAMLACARIGAIHSVVFGGFAPKELATRIDDAKPKVIVSASCGIEPGRVVAYKPLLDEAIEISEHKPERCIVLQRPMEEAAMTAGRDLDWAEQVASAKAGVAARRTACLWQRPIRCTSSTHVRHTGIPKGVVRDNGGHMVALKWTMKNIYDINPGEVYWAASDVGWVVGHSYIVYAPLLHGCTTVIFEGKPIGTPDAGTFWRVISDHSVVALFTAPTAFRAIRKEDPQGEFIGKYDLSHFRTLFLAGERADPDTLQWAEEKLQVPVIDHWWQTETGWSIAANPMGLRQLPVVHGSPTVAMPGYDVQSPGRQWQRGRGRRDGGDLRQAAAAAKLPCRPCGRCEDALPWTRKLPRDVSRLLRNRQMRGYKDENGYVYIMARTDDVINVAGHRLSTGGMEEVLAEPPRCGGMRRDRHRRPTERADAACRLHRAEQRG